MKNCIKDDNILCIQHWKGVSFMEEIKLQKKVRMKYFNFKHVLKREEADIVLSWQANLFDFFALGIFCLTKSINSEQAGSPVKVYFAKRIGNSSKMYCRIIYSGGKKYRYKPNAADLLGKQMALVLDYISGISVDEDILKIVVLSSFFLHVNGYAKNPRFARITPLRSECPLKEFRTGKFLNPLEQLRDTIKAQEMAYSVLASFIRIFEN